MTAERPGRCHIPAEAKRILEEPGSTIEQRQSALAQAVEWVDWAAGYTSRHILRRREESFVLAAFELLSCKLAAGAFKGGFVFEPWALVVLRNKCIDELRRGKFDLLGRYYEGRVTSEASDQPDAGVDLREYFQQMRRHLDRFEMPQSNRRVNYRAFILLNVRMTVAAAARDTSDVPVALTDAVSGCDVSYSAIAESLVPWSAAEESMRVRWDLPTLGEIWVTVSCSFDKPPLIETAAEFCERISRMTADGKHPTCDEWYSWKRYAKARIKTFALKNEWKQLFALIDYI